MKKLMMAVVVAAGAASALAMPTKDELTKAQPLVVELMADDMAAFKSAGAKDKSAAAIKVADKSVEFASSAETEAAKFLLLKGAVNFYTRGEAYDKAADTVTALQTNVKDVSPEVIAEITGKATGKISETKAPRLFAQYRAARLQVRASTEVKTLAKKLKTVKSDVLQRRYAEALAVSGNWKAAYGEFAKLTDANLKAVVDAEAAGKAKNAVSGEFWWTYEPAMEDADDFFKAHAVAYYRKALDAGEVSGLKKNLVEKRIAGMAVTVNAVPKPIKKEVAVNAVSKPIKKVEIMQTLNLSNYGGQTITSSIVVSEASSQSVDLNQNFEIALPTTSYSLAQGCFSGRTSLTGEISLYNCDAIGNKAFAGCRISKVVLKPGIALPSHCFENCTSLSKVANFNKCTSIGDSCFTQTCLGGEIWLDNCGTIGANAFMNCNKITKVVLKPGITLPSHCFENCTSLSAVVNLNKCASIGDSCFTQTCLGGEIWLDNCGTIGANAFMNCNKITKVVLKPGAALSSHCFENCTALSKVVNLDQCASNGSCFHNTGLTGRD